MKYTLGGTALALALLALAHPALAEAPPPQSDTKAKTKVSLVSDSTAVEPGSTFTIAIHLQPEPEWHIYWLNSGDTGLPTRVTFEGPDGLSFGEIAWPAPSRFVDKTGGLTYGYDKAVVLQSEVRVPDDLLARVAEGSLVNLEAKVAWLACKENCIQGSVHLGLSLPVREVAAADRRSANTPLLAIHAARVPSALPAEWMLEFKPTTSPVKGGTPFELKAYITHPAGEALTPHPDAAASFVPLTASGLIVRGATAKGLETGGLEVTITGEADIETGPLTTELAGVLQLTHGGATRAFHVATTLERAPADPDVIAAALNPTVTSTPTIAAAGDVCASVTGGSGGDELISSFMLALLFAFVGGFILNAMPCVLPVLSIKMLSLVEQAQEKREVIWRHGLAYTAGVLASFLILAIVLVALQATNWAFQMQDPTFVVIFTSIVFAFALSLFGVFELSMPFASKMDATVANSHGYMSSFNYGIFAVLLGTPCTAPFLGPALTYAFTQPPLELTLLLLMVGLGLAFPFLVLARFPAWRRLMPRPGPWLITFKKAMGFLLVGTALFLIQTLAYQVSRDALVGFLIFLAFFSLALWIYGHWTSPARGTRSRVLATMIALGTVALSANAFISTEHPAPTAGSVVAGGITWLDFDQVDVNAIAQGGKTVFIDFTAEWCTTCKVNESGAIYTDPVREALKALNVTAVKGDFTIHKPEIAVWLQRFGQPSVPLYVVIPAGRPADAFALPTILSVNDVLAGLCRGGKSTSGTTASL